MKFESLRELGEQLRRDLEPFETAEHGSDTKARKRLLSYAGRAGSSSAGSLARRTPSSGRLVALGGAVALAAALGLWLWAAPAPRQEPLRFWIEERAGQVDDWVTARDVAQSLRFSDGSSVVASPQTPTRVMRVSSEGAALTLERGRLEAHVVHRDASRWQVAAGPFVVRVTGTRFRVGWDPELEKLQVSVSEGRVVVTGDGQPEHVLTAGSVLELSAATELAGASPALPEAPSGAAPRAPIPDVAPRRPSEPRPDFRELSTAGRYKEALATVEQLGFAAQCESLNAKDLLMLGSTANLAGRGDRAREVYQATRRRFPGSSEAGIATFLLGRLASQAGRASDATGWFKRYLREQPNGSLAREAAGRLLELAKQSGDQAQARAAAEDYLKRYPTGPHAPLAQGLLAAPPR
jgi:ferric-dicitrate binding protein FerR (iron transport regulator)